MYILRNINIGFDEIKDHVDDAVLIIKCYCLKSSFDHYEVELEPVLGVSEVQNIQAYWVVGWPANYSTKANNVPLRLIYSIMKTLYLLTSLTLTIISVRGANNFAGFILPSADGTTNYTCQTQDQVSEAFQFSRLYWSVSIYNTQGLSQSDWLDFIVAHWIWCLPQPQRIDWISESPLVFFTP